MGSAARLRGERPRRVAELYAITLELIEERGLKVLHGLPTAMLAKGWPDIVVMGPRGVLFHTLADEHSSRTREQVELLTGLRKAYCNAGLWRPQHLGGRIQAELDALSA